MGASTIIVETGCGLVTSEVAPHVQSATIKNTNPYTTIVQLDIPLHAWEATQSITRVVGGVTTTASGALSAAITVPARGTIALAITSTYNAPTDSQGTTLTQGTATKKITAQVTTIDGGAVTEDVVYDVLETAFLGTGTPRFPDRPSNGGSDRVALEEEFFIGRNPQDVAAVYDWLEAGGHNFADLISFHETVGNALDAVAAGLPAALDAAQTVPFASLTAAANSSNTTNTAINTIRTQLLTLANAFI